MQLSELLRIAQSSQLAFNAQYPALNGRIPALNAQCPFMYMYMLSSTRQLDTSVQQCCGYAVRQLPAR